MSHEQTTSAPSSRKIITTDSDEWKNSPRAREDAIIARERRESLAEIADLVMNAWKEVSPRLERDRDEFRARLARRRNGMMNRPPRAWCVAVRAADSRITPMNAIIVPQHAVDCVPGDVSTYREHTVTLDAPLLRHLCCPVFCDKPYNTVQEMQKKLGWSIHHIRSAIRKGIFQVRKIPHLDGKTGWPVPVLYTHRPLDPCAKEGKYSDVVWGTTIRYVCDHIPDDLKVQVRRVPLISKMMSQITKRVEDWFMGWQWICPACGETCRTIYYPLPPMALVEVMKGGEIHRKDAGDPDAISPGNQTFACMKCHQVMFHSRLTCETWNRLISHITGGLLYGHEVKRPDWYEKRRNKKFSPLLRREPSKRRAQIREMMETGMGIYEIARELRLATSTVGTHACKIYHQARVRDLREFRERLGEDRGGEGEKRRGGERKSGRVGEVEKRRGGEEENGGCAATGGGRGDLVKV